MYDQKFRQLRAKSLLPRGRLQVQTLLFQSLSKPKFQKGKSQGLSQGRITPAPNNMTQHQQGLPLLVIRLFFVQDTAGLTNDKAIATGPTVQESTNARYVTDSMPEPHVPGPPPQQGNSGQLNQGKPKTPPDSAYTNKGQSVG